MHSFAGYLGNKLTRHTWFMVSFTPNASWTRKDVQVPHMLAGAPALFEEKL